MRTNLISAILTLSNIVLLSLIISTPCFSQTQEEIQEQIVLEQGEKKIYAFYSQIAADDLSKVLGTWEDGTGNKINIYIAEKNEQHEKYLSLFKVDFTHTIVADIEIENFANGFEAKKPRLLTNVEDERFDYTTYKGCVCVFESFPNYEIVEDSRPNKWRVTQGVTSMVPVIIIHIDSEKYGYHRSITFDYNTGYISGTYGEYPIPFQKSSGDVILLEEKEEEPEYAIKIYNTPKRVKPDGESTVEITVILWEYEPGNENSNKRLAGKTINFVLDEYSEFKAGELSATTAVTDANGQARVIFTAPTGERLQEAPSLKLTSTVNAVCEEFNVDDKAYIDYILDDGKVMVEPTPAVISSEGIVPPDKRFPARIRAYFEDDNLNSLTNTKVRFWIDQVSPVGMLRGPGGTEGTELELITDEQGFAEVEYYYAAEKQLIRPVTESIKITSDQMAIPLEAKITVGMNIIFDLVENAYDGKGELNAGEEIPIRVKIKLAEYPNLDLSAFFNYWGYDEETGNQLLVKLEIERISTVPTYLIQRLSLEDPPEPGFSEIMSVRSFKDKGELNYLWVPESSVAGYQGYPKISPQTIGTHYYEAHLTLTDQDGNAIYEADHPARTAFFNIQTGMSADWDQIFFLSNPFKQDSKEDQLCAAALGVMGMGTFLSVNDALHMINTGDVDGLFSILFSEVKGGILDKVKVGSAYKELAVDLYTGMALAEKIGLEILKDKTGPITAMEGAIFNQLHNAFNWEAGQIVILRGYGDQKLFEETEAEEKDKDAGKSNFALAISGSESNPPEGNTASNKLEIPTTEKGYKVDEERKTSSLKNGYISIYIIPANMKVSSENAIEMKRY